MTNEEFQKIVLKELRNLTGKVDGLDSKVDDLDSKVDDLDNKVDDLDNKVEHLDSKVDHLDNKVDQMDGRVGNMENILNSVKEQTAELTEFREETRVNFRKLDRELREVKRSVSRVEINVAENWREISILKAAK